MFEQLNPATGRVQRRVRAALPISSALARSSATGLSRVRRRASDLAVAATVRSSIQRSDVAINEGDPGLPGWGV